MSLEIKATAVVSLGGPQMIIMRFGCYTIANLPRKNIVEPIYWIGSIALLI